MKFGKLKKMNVFCLAAVISATMCLQGCGSDDGQQANAGGSQQETKQSEETEQQEEKQQETEKQETEQPEAAEQLPDTIRWFNASYAILTELNGQDYNMFGGMKLTDLNQQRQQASLEASWDVTDRASADETLDWIMTEGHRVGFKEDMEYLAEIGLGEVDGEQRTAFMLENFDVTETEAENFVSWYEMYEQYGDNAIDGWDYCRALNLLSFYYVAGYYTEEEALDKSLEIAADVQTLFSSWDDLIDSYLRGYEYWAEESSADRRAIYEGLCNEADNPYAVDFNTTLEKSW